ncbi:MAG: glycosyltransferase family 39 protein [Planctomycetota bacterium]|nr:MAG: glycosyltransferase family 39 protein [Planctomycetota bacterium]
MFHAFPLRCRHYLLLLLLSLLLSLPNLGKPSLWDIDEGNNAVAAREMMESGNWIVPTFNYHLRVDKPALLYWLQIAAYRLCGVDELAARLPSALAAILSIFLIYELTRLLFDPATAILAGLVLATGCAFCASAHFANPDALLHALTVLTLFLFWRSFAHGGRGWFIPAGVSAGLAVLAKGPVGLLLPGAVIVLFLLTCRRLRLLWDRRLVLGALIFLLVALPWYVWVTNDTKGEFLRGFVGKHNLERFLNPLENHRGPIYYYLGIVLLGFAPWSAFLGLTCWYGAGKRARDDHALAKNDGEPFPAYRFLWCWIAVYLVFFSVAATKLPNYVLPIYAPLAILTARFLERWRRGMLKPPHWALHASLVALAFIGLGASLGLLAAGGAIDVAGLRDRQLPGLAAWAVIGLLPMLGAGLGWWSLRRRGRGSFVGAVTAVAAVFIGTLAAFGGVALDQHKAPRMLVRWSGARQTDREVRVACYQYFQPSLVFYCGREVQILPSEREALEFLRCPLPVFLFLPETIWAELEPKVSGPHVLARHYDLYRHCQVVVVGNR